VETIITTDIVIPVNLTDCGTLRIKQIKIPTPIVTVKPITDHGNNIK